VMNESTVLICVSHTSFPSLFLQDLSHILSPLGPFPSEFKIKGQEDFHAVYATLPLQASELVEKKIELMKLSSSYQIDIALIPWKIFNTKKSLVIFDMDSTLITSEVIDEMAFEHGVGERVKEITHKAMNGEIDFDQSLTQRVSLLKGLHLDKMEKIKNNLTFTAGTVEFLRKLKLQGVKTAIASGGFEFFALDIQKRLGIDYLFSNHLELNGSSLTGQILGPIVNAQRKEEIVTLLAQQEGLPLEAVAAIGDGANDIPMLLKAGLGVAVHAKEKVQKIANYRLNFGPMTHILSFMNDENL
jgi:phosphoserine phosphatase